jgi:hypothetical protein
MIIFHPFISSAWLHASEHGFPYRGSMLRSLDGGARLHIMSPLGLGGGAMRTHTILSMLTKIFLIGSVKWCEDLE